MKEIWKPMPVKGYPGYEISNTGRARSVDRYDRRGHFRKGKELKIRIPKLQVNAFAGWVDRYVRLSANGRVQDFDFNRIYCRAFSREEWIWNPEDKSDAPQGAPEAP